MFAPCTYSIRNQNTRHTKTRKSAMNSLRSFLTIKGSPPARQLVRMCVFNIYSSDYADTLESTVWKFDGKILLSDTNPQRFA